MYIRRIIICGFKSYKKKVVLDLHPGHNVVVGSNGSGKSNIYAALEFVLSSKYDILRHEQRKQLLHDSGQSGILNAYVDIIFDNKDGRFPINEDLVSIKRVIGGKKDEYFINKKHCDKSELNNLLESAGISKHNQYFIVPQGEISQRVKERDNERLKLIKEIAGTRIYDERRIESLKLMNNADNKRERVKMVITYFEERLNELKKEKDELAKFEKLDLIKTSIKYQIYNKEKQETENSLNKLTENENKTDSKTEDLHNELKQIRINLEQYKTEKNTLNKNYEKTGISLKKQRKNLQSILRLIVSLNTKKNSLQKNNETFAGKKEKYQKMLNELNKRIKIEKENLNKITSSFDKEKKKEIELREELNKNECILKDLYSKQKRLGSYRSKTERNKDLKKQINEYKKEIIEQEKLCKNIKNSINNDINKKIEKYQNELNKLKKSQKTIEKQLNQNEKNKEKYKKQRNKLQNQRKILWKEKNDLNKILDELTTKKDKNETDFRYTMNLSMFQSYFNLKRIENDIKLNGDSSKYKLSGKLYGALIENFNVIDNKYNIAVEAAAGNKLFYYLVENDIVASELIDIMQKERINRVTFIPLNQCKQKERKYPKGSADVIPIMKLLKYDTNINNLRGALIQIFGNTLIPQNLNIGFDFAIKENYQCVTLNGDIITSGGALDGGFNENKYKRLKTYNLIKEVNINLNDMNNNKKNIDEKIKNIESKLLEIDNEIIKIDRDINNNRNLLDETAEKLIEYESEIDIYDKTKSSKLTILEKHESNINRIQIRIDGLQNEIKQPLLNKLSDSEQEKIENLNIKNEEITSNLANFVNITAEIETEKSKIESLLRDNLNLQQIELISTLKRCNESYENDAIIDSINNKLQNETEKRDKLNAEINTNEKNMDSWNKRLKIIEKEYSNLIESEQELLFSIEEHSISSEKLVGKHQALQEKLNQFIKYIGDLGALSPEQINKYKNKSINSLNKTLKETEHNLIKYKNVNKKALDQYNSFNKEKKKLYKRNEQQLEDKDHIEKLMKHLDLKKDDAILRTFHAINDKFKKAFKQLVIRGNAKLLLFEKERDDDEDESDDDDESDYDDDDDNNHNVRKRRRRSSNLRVQKKRRNRRKSSMISSQSQYNDYDENGRINDKKYAGIGIRVSFGTDSQEIQDEDEEEEKEKEMDRTRDMRQLSGGQQTVVALALIFAIQRCDPSPFYVFDEIDAALDQQYRKAVAHIIGEMKSKTQFITTTFRPEILQQADKCFVVNFKAKISTVQDVDPQQVDITKYT